jgi:hypothetical protein
MRRAWSTPTSTSTASEIGDPLKINPTLRCDRRKVARKQSLCMAPSRWHSLERPDEPVRQLGLPVVSMRRTLAATWLSTPRITCEVRREEPGSASAGRVDVRPRRTPRDSSLPRPTFWVHAVLRQLRRLNTLSTPSVFVNLQAVAEMHRSSVLYLSRLGPWP